MRKNNLPLWKNRRASLLIHLLEYSSIEFELWLLDIAALDRANQLYLNEITLADRRYLKMNEDKIKKFDGNQMMGLEKVIQMHEKHANEQQNNLARILELIRYEMNYRTYQVNSIAKRIKADKTSPAVMKHIVKQLKAALSSDTNRMREIVSTFILCEIYKTTMTKVTTENTSDNSQIF